MKWLELTFTPMEMLGVALLFSILVIICLMLLISYLDYKDENSTHN
jgi:competence protein ComGC